MRNPLRLAGAASAMLMIATQVQAHAHLVSATPAPSSVGTAPKMLTLNFTEKLVAQFSGFDVSLNGAKVAMKVDVGPDGKSLMGMPEKPLGAGTYTVSWHSVTPDTHRLEGTYTFTVQ